MRYPDLSEIVQYHPYHISTFASFANVTNELMDAVIYGNEELTVEELRNISKYTGVPLSVLICPKLITLDRKRLKHRKMMKQLDDKLYEIWEWQKKGSKYADQYMNSSYHGRVDYVNMDLAFRSGRVVTYGRYIGTMEEMEQTISSAEGEFRPASRRLRVS